MKTIILTDEKQQNCEKPWIFKYQSAGNIMREITAYMSGSTTRTGDKKGPDIYSVFAAKGGIERTEYAFNLARDLAKDGQALYINMDLFPAGIKDAGGEWRGMSEAIYYLKSGFTQARWKIKGLITEKEGIKVLGPVHCSMDLVEMTKEDVEIFMDVLDEMREFKYVIIDIGFYSEAMLEICSRSDSISIISPKGEEYSDSTDYFLNQLKLMQRDNIEGRIEVVEYGGGSCLGDKRPFNKRPGLLAGVE